MKYFNIGYKYDNNSVNLHHWVGVLGTGDNDIDDSTENIILENDEVVSGEEFVDIISNLDESEITEEEMLPEDMDIVKELIDQTDSSELVEYVNNSDIVDLTVQEDNGKVMTFSSNENIYEEDIIIEGGVNIEDIEEFKKFMEDTDSTELAELYNTINEEGFIENDEEDSNIQQRAIVVIPIPKKDQGLLLELSGGKYKISGIGDAIVSGLRVTIKNTKKQIKYRSKAYFATLKALRTYAKGKKKLKTNEAEFNQRRKKGQKQRDHSTAPKKERELSLKGKKHSSRDLLDKKTNKLKRRRYYDKNGKAIEDIDFSHSGKYKFPHRHTWKGKVRSKH